MLCLEGVREFLFNWQTLLSGLIALFAATITIILTLSYEKRRERRNILALRRSLGVEVRVCLTKAIGIHLSLRDIAKGGSDLSAFSVQSYATMPEMFIFLSNASRIGDLGEDSMNIYAVYQSFFSLKERIGMLKNIEKDNKISPYVIISLSKIFLEICEKVLELNLLEKFDTGNENHKIKDKKIIEKIRVARKEFPST